MIVLRSGSRPSSGAPVASSSPARGANRRARSKRRPPVNRGCSTAGDQRTRQVPSTVPAATSAMTTPPTTHRFTGRGSRDLHGVPLAPGAEHQVGALEGGVVPAAEAHHGALAPARRRQLLHALEAVADAVTREMDGAGDALTEQ